MKVTVSCLGRFHAFALAGQLDQRGRLARLFTSYPAHLAVRSGIDPARVAGQPLFELANRGSQRLERRGGARLDGRHLPARAFDRWVARSLPEDADLFVGWSGSTLRSLERARQLGQVTLVERGSSHILHQREVLEREYGRVGHRGRLPNPEILARELAEYEAADYVVVPTEFARKTFLAHGHAPERLLRVPYGVDLGAFHPPAAPPEGPLRILQVGNASLRKGTHLLLEAFDRLDFPGAELHFVGPIPDEIRPFAKLHAGPRIHFHGSVPQAELRSHYHAASVFCLASLEEGMAMVLSQAMACGLPVVATEASGAGELVRSGEQGLLVDGGNVEALMQALERLLRDAEERRAMGQAAAARVERGFSWNDYGDRIVRAYAAALRTRQGTAEEGRAA